MAFFNDWKVWLIGVLAVFVIAALNLKQVAATLPNATRDFSLTERGCRLPDGSHTELDVYVDDRAMIDIMTWAEVGMNGTRTEIFTPQLGMVCKFVWALLAPDRRVLRPQVALPPDSPYRIAQGRESCFADRGPRLNRFFFHDQGTMQARFARALRLVDGRMVFTYPGPDRTVCQIVWPAA